MPNKRRPVMTLEDIGKVRDAVIDAQNAVEKVASFDFDLYFKAGTFGTRSINGAVERLDRVRRVVEDEYTEVEDFWRDRSTKEVVPF